MSASDGQAARGYDRWCDDQGTHIPDGCLGSRVYVRFAGQDTPVSIRPYLVRVLTVETDTSRLSAEHVIEQLQQLLPAAGGDGHDCCR